MYVSMENMLNKANKEQYAVMAINCFNLESAYATIKAAEEMDAPIIIDLLMEHLEKHLGMEVVLPPIIDMAKKAAVDVAINLDHGTSEAFTKNAIESGFSSVMIDASAFPYEENIEITKRIVGLAKNKGITVEAEVGNMGAVLDDNFTKSSMYTNPDQAIDFIQKTGVTALALSFGSSRGIMPEGYGPTFDFDIVRKIKAATQIPLVLHGGSGCGEENIKKAIKCGINKVNVGSDVMKAQLDAVLSNGKSDSDFVELVETTINPAKDVVKYYIEISGSKGKKESRGI
ncbi:MAG: class II fructose-bisphosphate aldolase family protein [Aerococcus sp.]|nr:class II fructose-bisphosphate aldolase family protein [Aerococcus sp.]